MTEREMSEDDDDNLNDRQTKFVRAYINSRNATQSAIAAGYAAGSAHVHGCRLLKLPKIAAKIGDVTHKSVEKHGITADRVISELAKIGFAPISKKGAVKTGDKRQALVDIGKHIGLFRDTLDVGAGVTVTLLRLSSSASQEPVE